MEDLIIKVEEENGLVFSIGRDGNVVLGENITLNEASKHFWEAIMNLEGNHMVERLEYTHPEVAKFFQGVAHREHPYGVAKISGLYYLMSDGKIMRIKEPGRNQLCPCESGKKYKNCCK